MYFFHGSEMGAWLGFAIIFVARPFHLFGWMADTFGKRSVLLLSIYVMCTAWLGLAWDTTGVFWLKPGLGGRTVL